MWRVCCLSCCPNRPFLSSNGCAVIKPQEASFSSGSNAYLYSTLTTNASISNRNHDVNLFLVTPYWPPSSLPGSIIPADCFSVIDDMDADVGAAAQTAGESGVSAPNFLEPERQDGLIPEAPTGQNWKCLAKTSEAGRASEESPIQSGGEKSFIWSFPTQLFFSCRWCFSHP